MLAALRGVLREAWRLGQMTAEDYQRAVDLESVRGSSVQRGRALSRGELKALVDHCRADQGPTGSRDAALLAVLYGAGARRAEAVALEFSDFDMKTGELTIQRGKGGKGRLAYATNGGMDALKAWIAVRGTDPGPLFYRGRKGGQLVHARMTPQAVLDIVRRRADGAGVKRFSPHDLRRTFICELLDAGADLSTTRSLAGHSNVQTTARYDRRDERSKRKAAEMLYFPY
jgi:integrase